MLLVRYGLRCTRGLSHSRWDSMNQRAREAWGPWGKLFAAPLCKQRLNGNFVRTCSAAMHNSHVHGRHQGCVSQFDASDDDKEFPRQDVSDPPTVQTGSFYGKNCTVPTVGNWELNGDANQLILSS
jgi:hypothetical protein